MRAVYPIWLLYSALDRRLGHSFSIRGMKRDWDARATQDARYFIALDSGRTDAEFVQSGERDVAQLVGQRIKTLLPAIDPNHAHVLEIGCGTGRMTRPLSRLFGHVTGIDVSEEMIFRARSSLVDIENITLLVGNGIDLAGLEERSVDLVVSFLVFQHIPDKSIISRYFDETRRVLRQNGTFFFQVRAPVREDRRLAWRPKNTWIGALLSENEVEHRLGRVGFRIVESWYLGTSLFVIARAGT